MKKNNIVKGIIVAVIAATGVAAFIFLKKKFFEFMNAKPEPKNEE